MNCNFRNSILSLVAILLAFGMQAQLPQEVLGFQKKYPDEKLVRLLDEQTVTIKLRNGAFEILYEVVEEDLYLTSDAHMASKASRSFSHFFELDEIEASNWNLDRGRYRESSVKEFKTKDRLDQSFRDDSKSVSFFYNNLSEGSKSRIDYAVNIKDPRFLPAIFFADHRPMIAKKAVLKVDKDIDIKFIEQNLDQVAFDFSVEEKRGYKYYTWIAKDIDGMKYDSQAPSIRRFVPHIIPVITQYRNGDGQTVPLLNDVQGLYSWYSSLVKSVNTEPHDPELEKLVQELIKDKKSDLEKVRAIYYWTQENIKYIDFEYALGGFIPRNANDVFQKKYGDCKDNSSIMKEMLKIAGLKGSLSWLGTRDIPYEYDTVATPSVDNHMILTYRDNETLYFLDATGRYQPLELPTAFIQGKQILIEDGAENYRLDRVPIVPASKNFRKDTLQVSIQEGDLVGKGISAFGGYYKQDLYRILERLSPSDLKEYLENELRAGSNKFLIDRWDEENLFSHDADYFLDYDFNIKNYVQSLSDEIYVNLNLQKDLEVMRIDKQRELPIEYDYKSNYSIVTTLDIPEGYQVAYLPKNIEIDNELLDASITYELTEDKIIYTHMVNYHYLELSKEQQTTINKLIDTVAPSYNEVVVLQKNN